MCAKAQSKRTAFVAYYSTGERTFIFLVRPGTDRPEVIEVQPPLTAIDIRDCATRINVDFNGLPPHWDQGREAELYRRALDLPPAVNAAKRAQAVRERTLCNPRFRYTLTYLEQVSRALLPPQLKQALSDCELICFVPHGPLHALPFSAFQWSDGEYLIERFGICQVPSLTALRHCQARNRSRLIPAYHSRQCLIAAVAASDDEDEAFFEQDGATLRQLFAERVSASRVNALVGADGCHDRTPASKANVLAAMCNSDIIHFACHGVFGDATRGTETGLLVSNGQRICALSEMPGLSPRQRLEFLLTPNEVFAQQLQADLVTLRACSSGHVGVRLGDELTGMTSSLLYAGAASLIVSLWDVNKQSSQKLLDAFYDRWIGHEPPPKWQALREAQLAMLQSEQHAHPYHWAAMQLVGDWQ